ncbi:hypothetical protein JCM1841_000212 [Sporobolomyces salmonicolor]
MSSASSSPPLLEPTPHTLGGISLSLYGFDSLSSASDAKPVAILFLLHGRLGSAAHKSINRFASSLLAPPPGVDANAREKDLLVVAFDQRNHGGREVARARNLGWSEGGKKRTKEREELGMKEDELDNPSHAVDMMSIQTGTSRDVSFLIDFLPSSLFPNDERRIVDWYCAGISLGGHATWLALAHDPRLSLGIPIIGSPSTLTLLSHRATTQIAAPMGPLPVSAPYFPSSFLALLKRLDPDQVDLGVWKGRKLLVMSGAEDELVNFVHGGTHAFVQRLEKEGACERVEVWVQPQTGHACTSEMIERAREFVWRYGLCSVIAPGSPATLKGKM